MPKFRINKKKELVASSRGDTVKFHEKGFVVTRNVSTYIPEGTKRLDERVLEGTYFRNGRYSGDKSLVRGRVLKSESRHRDLIELTTKPLLHVTDDQLESFGYKKSREGGNV